MHQSSRHFLFALCLGLLMSSSAGAQTFSVLNAGFEAVPLGDGLTSNSVPSWSIIGSGLTLNPTSSQFAGEAPEGLNVASLGNSILATQGLGVVIPGTYTLTGNVGLVNGGTFNNLGFRLRGGTILINATSISNPLPAPGTFEVWTATYVILPTNANASALGTNLNILMLASTGSGASAAVDNISVTFVAVPEPTSIALIGTSVVAMLGYGWQRRRQMLRQGDDTLTQRNTRIS